MDYSLWKKDLFIYFLKNKSLIRLKYEGERVISQEKFKINFINKRYSVLEKLIFPLTKSPRVALIKIKLS